MEFVIISGKGGTGKTTIAASFAYLNEGLYINADCDVDASNLHLMFSNVIKEREDFEGAKLATIDLEKCIGCNLCKYHCRFAAIENNDGRYIVDPLKCEGCGACKVVCKHGAVRLKDEVTGETRLYETDKSIIAGALMIPGAEGSGKLVTQVRKMSKIYAEVENSHILIDGSPGVGCAVMASVTGCKYGIIVTEPTLSGYEDFVRVHALLEHFNMTALSIVNKYDINMDMTRKIESYCMERGIDCLGRIPFDSYVEKSINEGKPVVCYGQSDAGKAVKEIWEVFKLRGGI